MLQNSNQMWNRTIETFAHRIRAYAKFTQASVDEQEEIVWDVFADLACNPVSIDAPALSWDAILPVVRKCCSDSVSRWRPELYGGSGTVDMQQSHFDALNSNNAIECDWALDALNCLPRKQRASIQLRILEELPYQKVANRLGISQNAARFNVHHGLRRLREIARTKQQLMTERIAR